MKATIRADAVSRLCMVNSLAKIENSDLVLNGIDDAVLLGGGDVRHFVQELVRHLDELQAILSARRGLVHVQNCSVKVSPTIVDDLTEFQGGLFFSD